MGNCTSKSGKKKNRNSHNIKRKISVDDEEWD